MFDDLTLLLISPNKTRKYQHRKRCPFCDGQGTWWTDSDYGTSSDERPCLDCEQRGWILRKHWRRRQRHRRAMTRSIQRWLVRMGRSRGLEGMPQLVQPHTPANIEIGGGFCWHPNVRTWPRFGRVSHRSMLATWVRCGACHGNGVLSDLMGMYKSDTCTDCGGRGQTAGLFQPVKPLARKVRT